MSEKWARFLQNDPLWSEKIQKIQKKALKFKIEFLLLTEESLTNCKLLKKILSWCIWWLCILRKYIEHLPTTNMYVDCPVTVACTASRGHLPKANWRMVGHQAFVLPARKHKPPQFLSTMLHKYVYLSMHSEIFCFFFCISLR